MAIESRLKMVQRLATDFSELFSAVYEAPRYHIALEVALFVWVIWLLLNRTTSKPTDRKELTESEKEELIAEWNPEPLVPAEIDGDDVDDDRCAIDGVVGKVVMIKGRECVNFASFNFLDMVGNKSVADRAEEAVLKYGVGSCGPRGFYGTFDIHLNFEERLAKFLRCEEAALYSYGFSTVASVIPAYAKRSDIVFADQMVHYAIQKGIVASRSEVRYFRHNDVEHLEELLKVQREEDIQNPKKAKSMRRFMVIEGLYLNTGLISPLDQYVRLRNEYKVRIMLDESISIGVLGAKGTGALEHWGLTIDDIDVISGSLEYSFGSVGGFSAGSAYVVDHQRLSSLGYCFSASLPPFLTAAALEALNQIEKHDGSIQEELRQKSEYLHDRLSSINVYYVNGEPYSPIKHLRLKDGNSKGKLDRIIKFALSRNVLLTRPKYLPDEVGHPEPSIRIIVNYNIDYNRLDDLVDVLTNAIQILDVYINGVL